MPSIICDEIKVKKARTLELKVGSMTYQVEVSPEKVIIPNVGTYNGFDHRLDAKSEHMCGLQGYNPMQGDTCPACINEKQDSRIMGNILNQLRNKKLLKKYRT